MILTLRTHGHQTLEEVRRFLSGNEAVDFVLSDRVSAYSFIVETLVKFRYRALPRRDKGSIRSYLVKMTGKSESQVTRLIRQYLDTGRIRDRRGAQAHAFRRRYTKADIGLLADRTPPCRHRHAHPRNRPLRPGKSRHRAPPAHSEGRLGTPSRTIRRR